MTRLLTLIPLSLLLACSDKDTSASDDDDDGGAIVGTDADDDGFAAMPEGDDCDDSDPAINPYAAEQCDGIDNDCDGVVDEDSAEDAPTWYLDDDEDGFGDPETGDKACNAPEDDGPWVQNGDDCDDTDDDTFPGAEEVCNGTDDDCDDDTDEDATDATTWYADEDEDGYGNPAVTDVSCEMDDDGIWVDNGDDCDDADADTNPDTPEVCNDIDDDCDGLVDDADDDVDETSWSTFYEDFDGDSYGNADAPTLSCSSPDGYVTDSSDCDDANGDINPGQTEVCDDADNDEDCNGVADDDDDGVAASGLLTWVPDSDNDGYGTDSAAPTFACDDPTAGLDRFVLDDDSDCNDDDPDINPGEDEVCDDDDTDEDCSGAADDDDPDTLTSSMFDWNIDEDGDGYGTMAGPTTQCEDPSFGGVTYVSDSSDCNDDDPDVNPGEREICDRDDTDEDCSGAADDDDPDTLASGMSDWYLDSDGDGYGDQDSSTTACDDPSAGSLTYISDDTDCDDEDPAVNPDAAEICDGIDNDCDPGTDEAGGVNFTNDAGVVTDMTTDFGVGTRFSPAAVTLADDGELSICGGTLYTQLTLSADVDVVGAYGATLSGGDKGTVVIVESSASSVSFTDLSITEGDADQPYGSTTLAGGGIWCSSSALVFQDVTVSDCTSDDYAAGIYAASCPITADGLVVTGNTAGTTGGGVWFSASTHSLTSSEISDNTAPSGGALLLRSYADVTLTDTWVMDNTSSTHGSGAYITVDDLTCVATSPGSGGFLNNTGGSYGAVRFGNSFGTVTSEDCDWGEGVDDNSPKDFFSSYWTSGVDYDGVASFTCDGGDGCD